MVWDMIKEAFSQVLNQQRRAKQFTQDKLAERCELSLRYLQELEAGDKQPTLTTLFQLAEGLEIDPQELISPVWDIWRKQRTSANK